MSAIIFDSKPLVARMTAELQSEAAQFRKQRHRPARLAQIVAGDDGAAEVYNKQMGRARPPIGLGCATLAYPFQIGEGEIRKHVAAPQQDTKKKGVFLS